MEARHLETDPTLQTTRKREELLAEARTLQWSQFRSQGAAQGAAQEDAQGGAQEDNEDDAARHRPRHRPPPLTWIKDGSKTPRAKSLAFAEFGQGLVFAL